MGEVNIPLLQGEVLSAVDDGTFIDSGDWAVSKELDHGVLVNILKSLTGLDMITTQTVEHKKWVATPEGEIVASQGSFEARIFKMLPQCGLAVKELEAQFDKKDIKLVKVATGKAKQKKWISMEAVEGVTTLFPLVDTIFDDTKDGLNNLCLASPVVLKELKKRKLATIQTTKTYVVTRGPKFALSVLRLNTDLTVEMLKDGSWKSDLKDYNWNAMGLAPTSGHLHPLMKVRSQMRGVFLELGFEEMPTQRYVESSFWNFDSLFQPQQHPARDMHDTFFLTSPSRAHVIPNDYLQKVKETHEKGGFGSIGHRYNWSEDESRKNLLRTHTTAVSARVLYHLAQEKFKPRKFFSIDRVFRNESLDATHLAEFHQIEGMVVDRGLTLAHLLSTIAEFFEKLGMIDIQFKPTYNPYTEPSMEIFAFHPGLGRLVEIGNSGMFRPEMLRPMGLPQDVTVLAWGLSLERPTMIKYGYNNIRDLIGHKVDLGMIKKNGVCDMTVRPIGFTHD